MRAVRQLGWRPRAALNSYGKFSRLAQARKARIEQTTQHLPIERSPQPIEPYCHCLD
jgi:hypothetical protein